MHIKKQFQGTVAVYYAPYIVNSDPSGMDPAEIEAADKWYEGMRKHADGHAFDISFNTDEDPFFGIDEATGLLALVVTYTCTIFEEREDLPPPPAEININ